MSVELQHQLEMAEVHLKFAARMAAREGAADLAHHRDVIARLYSQVDWLRRISGPQDVTKRTLTAQGMNDRGADEADYCAKVVLGTKLRSGPDPRHV